MSHKKFKKVIKVSEAKNNYHSRQNADFEITGTLSPLKRQKPITTTKGSFLISEFEFSDDSGKIPLVIWGPVPPELFPYRYEFIRTITISGVRVKQFKMQNQLNLQKSAKFFIHQHKAKSLVAYLGT
jgi:hypothetical protein